MATAGLYTLSLHDALPICVGRNEELVGRALRGRREGVVVATKFGNVRGEDGSFKGVNGKPEYVRSACEASLKRLGDRKSTRLNSSHVRISYAVFCLKKKRT